jgi:hypothetical protein
MAPNESAPKEPASSAGSVNANAEGRAGDNNAVMFLGITFWVVVIGLITAIFSANFRSFLSDWWGALAGTAAAIAILMVVWRRRRIFEAAPFTTRAGVFIAIVLPVLFGAVCAFFLVVDVAETRAKVVRIVFVVLACVLPAMMWYLFIVARKASLLNEFLANLARLGLLQVSAGETPESKDRRVESYLQKFEAMYGDLRASIYEDVRNNKYTHYSRADAMPPGGQILSTATYPVTLFTVLVAIGWLITLPPLDIPKGTASVWIRSITPTIAPITLAFLGAYFFSVQMLFRRYVLRDLGGAAYVAAAIRIVLAMIGIWTISALGPEASAAGNQKSMLSWDNQLLVIGFVIGVFPRVIWQIIAKLMQSALPSMTSQLPLSELDGLTVWHEDRLEEEDIENMPNMANADLVDLMLYTRFPPEQIVDWVDQAILYTQLGPAGDQQDGARHRLRAYGIRTATSLLWASAESQRQGNRAAFDTILAPKGGGESVLPTLEASLSTNSNLKLIERWRTVNLPIELRPKVSQAEPTAIRPAA